MYPSMCCPFLHRLFVLLRRGLPEPWLLPFIAHLIPALTFQILHFVNSPLIGILQTLEKLLLAGMLADGFDRYGHKHAGKNRILEIH